MASGDLVSEWGSRVGNVRRRQQRLQFEVQRQDDQLVVLRRRLDWLTVKGQDMITGKTDEVCAYYLKKVH